MSRSTLPDDPEQHFRENPERLRALLDDDVLGPKLRKLAEAYEPEEESSS